FNKDAKDLSPAQAAFLAGLIQAPAAYDPLVHYELAQERETYVIQGMVATTALSPEQADKATKEDVKSELHIQSTARQSKAPHFVDHVLVDLENLFGSAAVQQGSIVVRTTLDLGVQQVAQQAVANGVHDLAGFNVNNSALLAADPKTGEIRAWVGSADYGNDAIGGQFDVVLSPRQPGSSFKPYVYEAALRDHKITWSTILHDKLTNFNGYMPRDFDNGGMGDIKASTAVLTQSEAFLMTDVLKNYQNTWHFGWNRQMASKTGTSDNGKGGIPDSWIMAYNPDIVIGVWVGNTAPNGGGGLIRAYGENV